MEPGGIVRTARALSIESSSEILNSPNWLPISYDTDRKKLQFSRITIAEISDMPFHDGRQPIAATNDIVEIEEDRAKDWLYGARDVLSPPRLILHTGFCGSTLLSRVLSVPGKVFVLREPRAITQLSNFYASLPANSGEAEELQLLFDMLLSRFVFWAGTEVKSVIKLSNWDNILISANNVGLRNNSYSLVISSEIRSYIISIFRGGKPRIRQTLELLDKLCGVGSISSEFVRQAQNFTDSMTSICCLIACCYSAQKKAIQLGDLHGNEKNGRHLTLESLRKNPVAELTYANQALSLDLSSVEVECAWNTLARVHAKDPVSAPFEIDKEIAFARDLEMNWGETIDSAIAWASKEGVLNV
ncbi:hypothetical protein [Microbulbifer hainanensis]|uniref:hypothetical protein n=1 Tax=Microbulbifer hainanensis TaxID=2735675 RepID=UPI001868F570|nr:hypothetical protein [Microbulbifer hainanensis]